MGLGRGERILVVDDSQDTLAILRRNLTSEGFEVFTAQSVAAAVELLGGQPVDVVITDLKMPGASGLDLVRYVREHLKFTEVLMITGYPTVDSAVQAVKIGAEGYLAKPFTDEELLGAVQAALEKLAARKTMSAAPAEAPPPFGLLGESEAMREILGDIQKAARSTATVLITGESGTGKELVARAIHYGSPRAPAPFVPVNCGGIPGELLESELFGHLKGAFTGANVTRAGFVQAAEGGTIFLDEVSEMPPPMQVKLLRVLQEKEICMVGSTRQVKVDVRIMAATNKDLQTMVQKGTFREDLFYRLNVLPIVVPPLRRRGNDVLLLARHFATRYGREHDRAAPRFSEAALEALRGYSWPGNVRELENLVQRLIVMVDDDVIDVPDLPYLMRFPAPGQAKVNRSLLDVEVEHIRNVLASVDGNRTKAAEILGIDRKTLREKLKKTGTPDSTPDPTQS
jgi:two-component system, NtrC family, response regulator HydG